MLDAYGRVCSCCGESNEAFLTMDHYGDDVGMPKMRSDGYATKIRGVREYARLKKLGWPTVGIRVLCMNCNFGTRTGCPCPHIDKGKEYDGHR